MSADNTVFLDFETHYAEDYGVSDMSYWHYTHSPEFEAYQVSMVGPDLSYVGSVQGAPWDRLVGAPLVAHNAAFDKAVLERLIEQGLVQNLRTPSFNCSMDLCAALQMPKSLEHAAKEVLGITASKAMRNYMKGRRWKDTPPEKQKALSDYALKDSELCRQIWEKLSPEWPENERALSRHTREAGYKGLYIDQPMLRQAVQVLQAALFENSKMLPWFTSADDKPLSLVFIREQGRKDGIEVPGSLDIRNPDAMAWEKKYSAQFKWVRAIGGYRRINALLKKLQTLESMLRPDGYAPFRLKYCGAPHTRRWSGDGGWNLQNLPKYPVVVCKSCWGCTFDDGTLGEDEEKNTICPFCQSADVDFIDMRGMILAPPGKKLIVSDYAQVEARILLWLAGDTATLEQISRGESVYEAHARATMGWLGSDLKNVNKPLYSLAKARVLGAGYQCGAEKFVSVAKTMARLDISFEEAQTAITDYRASNPLITDRWRRHNFWLRVSTNHHDPTHEVELRSGRNIRYFEPHIWEDSDPKWPEIVANVVKGDARQLRKFYGGKLTENETQATARDVMGAGILALEAQGIPVLFHTHDEVVCAVDEDMVKDAVPVLDRTLVTAAEWARSCPLAVETKVADRYFK